MEQIRRGRMRKVVQRTESQMELEEEHKRRVQTLRRGGTDEQEKGGQIQGRGLLFENRLCQ